MENIWSASSFKPYYNWNIFNTEGCTSENKWVKYGFKPYYNWNTFNTNSKKENAKNGYMVVLNLVIRGLPLILILLNFIIIGAL